MNGKQTFPASLGVKQFRNTDMKWATCVLVSCSMGRSDLLCMISNYFLSIQALLSPVGVCEWKCHFSIALHWCTELCPKVNCELLSSVRLNFINNNSSQHCGIFQHSLIIIYFIIIYFSHISFSTLCISTAMSHLVEIHGLQCRQLCHT